MSFFSEYKQVTQLLQQKLPVVFYSESRHYYPYYERLIDDLLVNSDTDIYYITSDANDPVLQKAAGRIKPVYIKWMLGFLFSRIRAEVMIMTMPDLGNYLFKRSAAVGCYVYIFHAAVSTHQQYRQKAFYNYDCIFCVGAYQKREIRKAEELHGLQKKELIEYGYPLFDEIKKQKSGLPARNADKETILIAPSWFEGCIFDSCLEELLQQLSSLPYKVILRSHPEYAKRRQKEFRKIQRLIENSAHISLDTIPSVTDSILNADILVTDRSGIAFEFAFGVGKPVLFIETAPKEINPGWQELHLLPVENLIREKLGVSIYPNELSKLPAVLTALEKMTEGFENGMRELGNEYFYNYGGNYQAGSSWILQKLLS